MFAHLVVRIKDRYVRSLSGENKGYSSLREITFIRTYIFRICPYCDVFLERCVSDLLCRSPKLYCVLMVLERRVICVKP